jgi:acetyl/propionyl-CoA carboxylase alpha subunit
MKAHQSGMSKLQFDYNGQSFEAYYAFDGKTLWYKVAGATHAKLIESADARSRRSTRAQGNVKDTGAVLAPMPGRVIKVAVEAGREVLAGDVLVVMEAMKMEYILKAPRAGRVTQVKCQASQQVELGQLLVQFEAQAGET